MVRLLATARAPDREVSPCVGYLIIHSSTTAATAAAAEAAVSSHLNEKQAASKQHGVHAVERS